jgi:putative hydrolase of the HAD superfamily
VTTRYDAVTFDYWQTLVRAPQPDEVRSRRTEAIAAVLRRYELEIEDVRLREATEAVFETHHQHWLDNMQFTASHACVLLFELLEVEAQARVLDASVRAWTGEDAPPVVELTANVVETLHALHDAGLRIGIICDVGMAPSTVLRHHLAQHGILDCFDHTSFSDEVGWYKPAPEIFEHALVGLGVVDPSRAAHVGDLRRTDVAGAQAMGMTAVRYRGSNDDTGEPGDPEADHVIVDHAELLDVLGIS